MTRKYDDKRMKPGILRTITVGLMFAMVAAGLVFHSGTGTLASMGWGYIASICPLGALEAMLGNGAFVPRLVIAFVFMVLVVLMVGRAFCAWLCPVPFLSRFFKGKIRREKEAREQAEAGRIAIERYDEGEDAVPRGGTLDSRHIVLCGALGSAAIFGFPVFCLVCPIGITFAIMVGVARLVGFNEPSMSLVFFAIVLVFELIFLRKWCSKICPVGALLSLVSEGSGSLP